MDSYGDIYQHRLKAVLTKSVNEAGPDMVPPHYWALEGIQNAIAHGMGLEGG